MASAGAEDACIPEDEGEEDFSAFSCEDQALSNPGGDHPDDVNEVSDAHYLQDVFDLSDYDLTALYMRTAMKKGKIGIWYKKRFMDIFIESRTKYMDAPQEVKDAIDAEFQAMGDKLEQRSDQAKSDWNGAPDIAVIESGYHKPYSSLMLRFGEPVVLFDTDIDPFAMDDYPILVVPSGGLYGLEKSEFFKATLGEYVNRGGTLIVFAQQHGYEFGVLPVPQEADGTYRRMGGYGWAEDQACFTNGTHIHAHARTRRP